MIMINKANFCLFVPLGRIIITIITKVNFIFCSTRQDNNNNDNLSGLFFSSVPPGRIKMMMMMMTMIIIMITKVNFLPSVPPWRILLGTTLMVHSSLSLNR